MTAIWRATVLGSSIALLGLASHASAVVILSDGYSGHTDGSSLNGQSPDGANVGGGTYISHYYFGGAGVLDNRYDSSVGNSSPSVITDANNIYLISIASNTPYVKPTSLFISADIKLANTNAGDTGEFYDLGFLISDPGGSDGNHVGTQNGLNAVRFNTSGNLFVKTTNVASNGGSENVALINTYDSGALGTLSSSIWYNLSYYVNTVTGDISGITLASPTGSVTYDVTTTTFTDPNTNLVSVASGSGTAAVRGHIDNLLVTSVAVPEPTSVAMLGVAGAGLLTRRRKNG